MILKKNIYQIALNLTDVANATSFTISGKDDFCITLFIVSLNNRLKSICCFFILSKKKWVGQGTSAALQCLINNGVKD